MAEPSAKRAAAAEEATAQAPCGRFVEQVIIVTGGADGLGKAIVERLATRERARAVAIFDMAKERGEALTVSLTQDPSCVAEVSGGERSLD